jgi:YndJ-like protein
MRAPSLIDVLLMLAPLALVPLGLRLAGPTEDVPRRLLRLAVAIQPFAAVGVVASFLLPIGWTAGLLAVPWLLVGGVAALAGLGRLLGDEPFTLHRLVVTAALAYLAVGAGWLALSRFGIQPLGLAPVIVELTAVHFHYAGFAACLIAALTIDALEGGSLRLRRLAHATSLLIVAGSPLVATGFSLSSRLIQAAGAVVIASGVLAIAAIQFFVVARRVAPGVGRLLLRLSAASVVLPMVLAVEYSVGRELGLPTLDTQSMALIHGDLNAVGFAWLGLLGWWLIRRANRTRPPYID